jgi:predicted NBD/HSP70 family sugar kinase
MNEIALNAVRMKSMNRLRVLRLIQRGAVARSELAKATGLTRASMSLIIAELLEEGVLIETGLRRSTAGRKPVLLELRPEYACALGLTISRVGAEAGLVDLGGRLLFRCPVELNTASRARAILDIKHALRSVLESNVPKGRLLGIGINTPGPVDAQSGTVLAPPNFDLWHGVKLADKLKDVAGGHAFLDNNSQALTIAEKAYGAGREFNSFVLLVVDSGVGAGIIRGDERHVGLRGSGNEVGHNSINFNGPRCGCGLRGCVELYASVPAVLRRAQKDYPRLTSWQEFVDLAHTGDAICRRLMEEQARALATVLTNVLNVFELDAVVLAGDIPYRGDLLRASIERYINQCAINRQYHHIPVRFSMMGEHAGLRAAAGLAIDKFVMGELQPGAPSGAAPPDGEISKRPAHLRSARELVSQ